MQRLSRPQREVEFATANIWASVVHDNFNHVASVTHDETSAERQTAMGSRHAMRVKFAPGRNAVPLPVDGGNDEAGRSCIRRGQCKAKHCRQERAIQKHLLERKLFALSASYKVAARAEAEAGKLIHDRDVPRTDTISMVPDFYPLISSVATPQAAPTDPLGEARPAGLQRTSTALTSLIKANAV